MDVLNKLCHLSLPFQVAISPVPPAVEKLELRKHPLRSCPLLPPLLPLDSLLNTLQAERVVQY